MQGTAITATLLNGLKAKHSAATAPRETWGFVHHGIIQQARVGLDSGRGSHTSVKQTRKSSGEYRANLYKRTDCPHDMETVMTVPRHATPK